MYEHLKLFIIIYCLHSIEVNSVCNFFLESTHDGHQGVGAVRLRETGYRHVGLYDNDGRGGGRERRANADQRIPIVLLPAPTERVH